MLITAQTKLICRPSFDIFNSLKGLLFWVTSNMNCRNFTMKLKNLYNTGNLSFHELDLILHLKMQQLTSIYSNSSYVTWLIKPYVKQLLENFLIHFQETFKLSSFILKIFSIDHTKKTINKSHFTH